MYLEVQKQKERFGLRFWKLNDGEKGITNTLFQQTLPSVF